MARIRKCVHCGHPFIGRRDAKTCSTRCRKGLQRRRQMLVSVEKSDVAVSGLPQQAGA